MAISRFNKAFSQIPWRNVPATWIPTADGTMIRLDPDAPRYVREAQYFETTRHLEDELEIAKTNEADARRSAMEVSQREARWMMIENRLRAHITERCGFAVPGSKACDCVRCEMARELMGILNSDPPVGDGFRSEAGLDPNSVDPTSALGKLVANQLACDMMKS